VVQRSEFWKEMARGKNNFNVSTVATVARPWGLPVHRLATVATFLEVVFPMRHTPEI
jgi:hypothetical protein